MAISTLTDKGQTTVPQEIRKALKVRPRQQLVWALQLDGTAKVSPQRSVLELFGSLKSRKKFRGFAAERAAAHKAMAQDAVEEGLE